VFSDRKAIVRQFVDELALDDVDAAASMSPGANNPVTERFLGVENRRCKRAAWRNSLTRTFSSTASTRGFQPNRKQR
jgi:hypothetical protein